MSPIAEVIGRKMAPHIEFQSAGATETHIHPKGMLYKKRVLPIAFNIQNDLGDRF